jgi:hypothetical protein
MWCRSSGPCRYGMPRKDGRQTVAYALQPTVGSLGLSKHQPDSIEITDDNEGRPQLFYVEGFIEGCLERIGEDDPEVEQIFRDFWEETQREVMIESLKVDCEVGKASLEFLRDGPTEIGGGCLCGEDYGRLSGA